MADVSIIIPTYNDASTLPIAIKELDLVVAQASLFVEVLIIDDSSQDDTLEVAASLAHDFQNLHIRVFRHHRNRHSFGGLIRYGMAHAVGRYCAVVSGDGSDPVQLLAQMMKYLRDGATMVICSRFIRTGDAARVGPSYRLYQTIYRRAIRAVLGQDVTDSTYGFRAFNRIYILALGTSSTRFNIFPEMTFKVLQSGGRIEYLAGSPQPVGVGGSEKFKLPNELLGYAWVLLRAGLHRISIRWF